MTDYQRAVGKLRKHCTPRPRPLYELENIPNGGICEVLSRTEVSALVAALAREQHRAKPADDSKACAETLPLPLDNSGKSC